MIEASDFRLLIDSMIAYGRMLIEKPRKGIRRDERGELVCYYCGSTMRNPGEKHCDLSRILGPAEV